MIQKICAIVTVAKDMCETVTYTCAIVTAAKSLCDCSNTVSNADLTTLCKVESIIVALPLFLDLFTDRQHSAVQSEIDHWRGFFASEMADYRTIDHLFVNS